MIELVAFDGDDTLWHNESIFSMTQSRFAFPDLWTEMGRVHDELSRLFGRPNGQRAMPPAGPAINVWDDERDISYLEEAAGVVAHMGRPFRRTLEMFEARCHEYLAETAREAEDA